MKRYIKIFLSIFILTIAFSIRSVYAKTLTVDEIADLYEDNIIPELKSQLSKNTNYFATPTDNGKAVGIFKETTNNNSEIFMQFNLNNNILSYDNETELVTADIIEAENDKYSLALVLINSIIVASGRTDKIINIKNGMLNNGFDSYGVGYVLETQQIGNDNIYLLKQFKMKIDDESISAMLNTPLGIDTNTYNDNYSDNNDTNSNNNTSTNEPTKDSTPDDYTGKEDDKITNPQTGISSPALLIISILFIGTVFLAILRKKSVFRSI